MKKTTISDLYLINDDCIYNFEDKIIITEVGKNNFTNTNIFPVRTSSFSFFIIEEGEMEIELDYQLHVLKKHFFLTILPEHLIQSIKIRNDFKAQLMIVDQSYFSSIEMNNLRLYQPVFLNIRRHPGFLLEKEEYGIIRSCNERMRQKIIEKNHNLQGTLIKTLLIECILEMDNILINRNYSSNFQKLSHQENILYNFFQLLQQNVKDEHTVVFYSDKLNITPQYLALILKKMTGKTTRDWIAVALIIEAKILLKYSLHTVQQISESLNFCDASSFGKFFKNLTGITPFQFRKK